MVVLIVIAIMTMMMMMVMMIVMVMVMVDGSRLASDVDGGSSGDEDRDGN